MCQEVMLYQVPIVDARICMLTKLSRLSSSVYLVSAPSLSGDVRLVISFAEVVLWRPMANSLCISRSWHPSRRNSRSGAKTHQLDASRLKHLHDNLFVLGSRCCFTLASRCCFTLLKMQGMQNSSPTSVVWCLLSQVRSLSHSAKQATTFRFLGMLSRAMKWLGAIILRS